MYRRLSIQSRESPASLDNPAAPRRLHGGNNDATSPHRSSPLYPLIRPQISNEHRAGGRARAGSKPHYPSDRLPTGRNRYASMPSLRAASTAQLEMRMKPSPLSQVAVLPHSCDMDTESYRLAKACGQDALSASASSPAGRAFFKSEGPSLSLHGTSSRYTDVDQVSRRNSTSRSSPPPPLFSHPPVADVLRSAVAELQKQNCSLYDFMNPDALYEEVRFKRKHPADGKQTQDIRVFGIPVTELSEFAMCLTTQGNYQYQLPVVVVSCVEQLYRTGIYHVDLFRTLPDRVQLHHLRRQFDKPTLFSVAPAPCIPDLIHEMVPNICALLDEFIFALRAPLLPRCLFDVLWFCCVAPAVTDDRECSTSGAQRTSRDQREHDETHHGGPVRRHRTGSVRLDQMPPRQRRSRSGSDCPRLSLPMRPLLTATQSTRDETAQVTLAYHFLLMLPPRNFALLNYLLTFFSQLPLSPDNGVTYEDLSRRFAVTLFGCPRQLLQEPKTEDQGADAARLMMCWFLTRWDLLLDAFDTLDISEATDSLEQREGTRERRQSLFTFEGENAESDGGQHAKPPNRRSSLSNGRHKRTVSDGQTGSTTRRRVSFSLPFTEAQRKHESEDISSETSTALRQQLDLATVERDRVSAVVDQISIIVERYAGR